MKKVFAIALTLSALGAGQVFAQAKNLEGFNLGANLEVDRGYLSASDGASGDAHRTGLGLEARYDWAIDNQFLIGLGVSAGTGHRDAGTYATGLPAYTQDRYAIDVVPAYVLGNGLVVYGKLSALRAKAWADDASNTTVHGTGYGIGLRGLIDNHSYWQAGLDTHRYRDAGLATGTSAALKNNVLSLGVGYRF